MTSFTTTEKRLKNALIAAFLWGEEGKREAPSDFHSQTTFLRHPVKGRKEERNAFRAAASTLPNLRGEGKEEKTRCHETNNTEDYRRTKKWAINKNILLGFPP